MTKQLLHHRIEQEQRVDMEFQVAEAEGELYVYLVD
jgi:hypothetical protein